MDRIGSNSRIFFIPFVLVMAATATWASPDEHVILSTTVDDCTLSMEYRDVEPMVLRLRTRAPNLSICHVSKETMVEVLHRAFSSDELRLHQPPFTSLNVGRLVEYPWLSQYLAAAADHSHDWDARRGRPKTAPINRFVADILSSDEVLRTLNGAIRESDYCVTRASVEKVLVGRDADIPGYDGTQRTGRRPFDSLTWFLLRALEADDCKIYRDGAS